MKAIDNIDMKGYRQKYSFVGMNMTYADALTSFKTVFDSLSDWEKINSVLVIRGIVFRFQGSSAYSATPIRSSHTAFYYYGVDFNVLNFSRFEMTSTGTVNYADQTNTVISGTWEADFYVL